MNPSTPMVRAYIMDICDGNELYLKALEEVDAVQAMKEIAFDRKITLARVIDGILDYVDYLANKDQEGCL